ncbi:MAG TPA: T9SS type A sorting domain-containing protein, partial [Bacteroidota bacterium]|nr:T9SS type A sorting domain-containing protein [Bacteroidota bacterium]
AATTRWPMKRYDPSQSDFAAIATANPVPVSSAFLPKDRVYNWPNPVYGPTTQIRYYTSEDANISVRIYDLAGAKITELRGKSTAGIDGELTWDVSRIQSGVYLARVEADAGGQTGATIIKIAVVK